MVKIPSLTTLMVLAVTPSLLSSQESSSSRFALETYRGTTRTGVDEYVLVSPNAQSGRNAVLRSNAFIPSRGERITTEIDFDSRWGPTRIQFSSVGTNNHRTWTQLGDRRITFRSVTNDRETARELQRRGVLLAFDPDVPSLLSPLPYLEPGDIMLFSIRTATIVSARLIDHGAESKTIEGSSLPLQHLELVTGDGSLHCWFATDGNLALVEIPGRSVQITPRNR